MARIKRSEQEGSFRPFFYLFYLLLYTASAPFCLKKWRDRDGHWVIAAMPSSERERETCRREHHRRIRERERKKDEWEEYIDAKGE